MVFDFFRRSSLASITSIFAWALVVLDPAKAQGDQFQKLVGTWKNTNTDVTVVIGQDRSVHSQDGGLSGTMQRSVGGGRTFVIQGRRNDQSPVECAYDISFAEDKTSDWGLTKESPIGACLKGGRFVKVDSPSRGELRFADSRHYRGEIRDRLPNGQGTMTFRDGQRYDGEWSDGKRNGEGAMTFSDGRRYDGQWHNDQRSGRGIEVLPDGARYDGQWQNNSKNGNGVYTWPGGHATTANGVVARGRGMAV